MSNYDPSLDACLYDTGGIEIDGTEYEVTVNCYNQGRVKVRVKLLAPNGKRYDAFPLPAEHLGRLLPLLKDAADFIDTLPDASDEEE